MVMSNAEIRALLKLGIIVVEPDDGIDSRIGISSLDLRLSPHFRVQKEGDYIITLVGGKKIGDYYDHIEKPEGYILPPKGFVLGETIERLKLPPNISGELSTRSSYAQAGIQTNGTSTLVHANHNGRLILEIFNAGAKAVHLVPGDRVCQISFYPTQLLVDV